MKQRPYVRRLSFSIIFLCISSSSFLEASKVSGVISLLRYSMHIKEILALSAQTVSFLCQKPVSNHFT